MSAFHRVLVYFMIFTTILIVALACIISGVIALAHDAGGNTIIELGALRFASASVGLTLAVSAPFLALQAVHAVLRNIRPE
jgi:hypothetical protein